MDDLTGRFSGRDNARWTGNRISQCALCFELFSGESTFVLHRIVGERPAGLPGENFLGPCRDPASKGMALGTNGAWKRVDRTLEGAPEHSRDRSGAVVRGGT